MMFFLVLIAFGFLKTKRVDWLLILYWAARRWTSRSCVRLCIVHVRLLIVLIGRFALVFVVVRSRLSLINLLVACRCQIIAFIILVGFSLVCTILICKRATSSTSASTPSLVVLRDELSLVSVGDCADFIVVGMLVGWVSIRWLFEMCGLLFAWIGCNWLFGFVSSLLDSVRTWVLMH
jgi:hypothetical protein